MADDNDKKTLVSDLDRMYVVPLDKKVTDEELEDLPRGGIPKGNITYDEDGNVVVDAPIIDEDTEEVLKKERERKKTKLIENKDKEIRQAQEDEKVDIEKEKEKLKTDKPRLIKEAIEEIRQAQEDEKVDIEKEKEKLKPGPNSDLEEAIEEILKQKDEKEPTKKEGVVKDLPQKPAETREKREPIQPERKPVRKAPVPLTKKEEGLLKTVLKGIKGFFAGTTPKNLKKQIILSVVDMGVEIIESAKSLNAWQVENIAGMESLAEAIRDLKITNPELIDSIAPPNSGFEAMVREMLPYLGGLGVGLKSKSVIQGLAKVTVAEGVIGFIFDETEGTLTDMLWQYKPMRPFLIDYLLSEEDDSEVERRLKNALEAMGLTAGFGIAIEAYVRSAKLLKQLRKRREIEQTLVEDKALTKDIADEIKEIKDTEVKQTASKELEKIEAEVKEVKSRSEIEEKEIDNVFSLEEARKKEDLDKLHIKDKPLEDVVKKPTEGTIHSLEEARKKQPPKQPPTGEKEGKLYPSAFFTDLKKMKLLREMPDTRKALTSLTDDEGNPLLRRNTIARMLKDGLNPLKLNKLSTKQREEVFKAFEDAGYGRHTILEAGTPEPKQTIGEVENITYGMGDTPNKDLFRDIHSGVAIDALDVREMKRYMTINLDMLKRNSELLRSKTLRESDEFAWKKLFQDTKNLMGNIAITFSYYTKAGTIQGQALHARNVFSMEEFSDHKIFKKITDLMFSPSNKESFDAQILKTLSEISKHTDKNQSYSLMRLIDNLGNKSKPGINALANVMSNVMYHSTLSLSQPGVALWTGLNLTDRVAKDFLQETVDYLADRETRNGFTAHRMFLNMWQALLVKDKNPNLYKDTFNVLIGKDSTLPIPNYFKYQGEETLFARHFKDGTFMKQVASFLEPLQQIKSIDAFYANLTYRYMMNSLADIEARKFFKVGTEEFVAKQKDLFRNPTPEMLREVEFRIRDITYARRGKDAPAIIGPESRIDKTPEGALIETPTGLGAFYNKIRDGIGKLPFGTGIVASFPLRYMNPALAFMNDIVMKTPGLNLLNPETRRLLRGTPGEKSKVMYDMVIGSALYAMGYELASRGTLSGYDTSNKVWRDPLEGKGRTKHNVIIFNKGSDKETIIKFPPGSPFFSLLSLGATIQKAVDSGLPEEDAYNFYTMAFSAYMNSMTDGDFAERFDWNAIKFLFDEEGREKFLTGAMAGTFRMFVPYGGALYRWNNIKGGYKQTKVVREDKPNVKGDTNRFTEWERIWEQVLTNIQALIPGNGVPPVLDAFGKAVFFPSGIKRKDVSPIVSLFNPFQYGESNAKDDIVRQEIEEAFGSRSFIKHYSRGDSRDLAIRSIMPSQWFSLTQFTHDKPKSYNPIIRGMPEAIQAHERVANLEMKYRRQLKNIGSKYRMPVKWYNMLIHLSNGKLDELWFNEKELEMVRGKKPAGKDWVQLTSKKLYQQGVKSFFGGATVEDSFYTISKRKALENMIKSPRYQKVKKEGNTEVQSYLLLYVFQRYNYLSRNLFNQLFRKQIAEEYKKDIDDIESIHKQLGG